MAMHPESDTEAGFLEGGGVLSRNGSSAGPQGQACAHWCPELGHLPLPSLKRSPGSTTQELSLGCCGDGDGAGRHVTHLRGCG